MNNVVVRTEGAWAALIRRRKLWYVLNTAGFLVWVNVLLKLFVVDHDVFLAQSFFPDLAWLLQFKLIFFVGLVALLLLLMGTANALGVIAYIAVYPIILVIWTIPAFIVRHRSWILAVAIVNSVFSFFQSIKYRGCFGLLAYGWCLGLLLE